MSSQNATQILPDSVTPIRSVELTVHSFGMTDIGRTRATNQDHFLVAKLSRAIQLEHSSLAQAKTLFGDQHGHLFLVADGMGGHAAGEQASSLVLMTIEAFILNSLKWFFSLHGENILAEFQEALRAADARVFEESSRHPELKGMGTTLTMGYSNHGALYVIHVGDSRCYLLRRGTLTQLTRDHTLVAEMVRDGLMSQDEVASSPIRNVITNAVGGDGPGLKVEVHKVPIEPGDVVLFCSDGLTGMVADARIAEILGREWEPEAACKRLVEQANEMGGRDNITAIVARFDGGP